MQLIRDRPALGVVDRFDPRESIRGGVRHLRYLLERYHGNVVLALAAYNAGEGAVDAHRGMPPYPETRHYVQRVLQRAGLADSLASRGGALPLPGAGRRRDVQQPAPSPPTLTPRPHSVDLQRQLTTLRADDDNPAAVSSASPQPLRLGQILVQARVVTDDVLDEALARAATRPAAARRGAGGHGRRRRRGRAEGGGGPAGPARTSPPRSCPPHPPCSRSCRRATCARPSPARSRSRAPRSRWRRRIPPIPCCSTSSSRPCRSRSGSAWRRGPPSWTPSSGPTGPAPRSRRSWRAWARPAIARATPRTTSITCATWPSRPRWCAW